MVFAVLAVTALFVIPQWMRANDEAPRDATTALVTLLRDARRVAIEARQRVNVYVDPASGVFPVLTLTGRAGMELAGRRHAGAGALGERGRPSTGCSTSSSLLGAAFGDTVVVRGTQGAALVAVDPWSGTAVIHAR